MTVCIVVRVFQQPCLEAGTAAKCNLNWRPSSKCAGFYTTGLLDQCGDREVHGVMGSYGMCNFFSSWGVPMGFYCMCVRELPGVYYVLYFGPAAITVYNVGDRKICSFLWYSKLMPMLPTMLHTSSTVPYKPCSLQAHMDAGIFTMHPKALLLKTKRLWSGVEKMEQSTRGWCHCPIGEPGHWRWVINYNQDIQSNVEHAPHAEIHDTMVLWISGTCQTRKWNFGFDESRIVDSIDNYSVRCLNVAHFAHSDEEASFFVFFFSWLTAFYPVCGEWLHFRIYQSEEPSIPSCTTAMYSECQRVV